MGVGPLMDRSSNVAIRSIGALLAAEQELGSDRRAALFDQQGSAQRALAGLFCPLAADFVQAVRAQLKLLTDALQHGALLRVLAIAIGAGDVVRSLALFAVV